MKVLEHWITEQTRHSVAGMLRGISPDVVKARKGFGQTIVPKKGCVVASPVPASYDPDPDYFFHWYRDSALVMDALRLVRDMVPDARRHFDDFVRFSLDLAALDGRNVPPDWQSGVQSDFRKFLRKDLQVAHGDVIPAETRVNPDGTLDITDWPRPQHDGPALRALTVLRWGVETVQDEALLRSRSRLCAASCAQALFRYLGRRNRASLLYFARLRSGLAARKHVAGVPRRGARESLPGRGGHPGADAR